MINKDNILNLVSESLDAILLEESKIAEDKIEIKTIKSTLSERSRKLDEKEATIDEKIKQLEPKEKFEKRVSELDEKEKVIKQREVEVSRGELANIQKNNELVLVQDQLKIKEEKLAKDQKELSDDKENYKAELKEKFLTSLAKQMPQ